MRGGRLRAAVLLLGFGATAALACGGGDFNFALLADRDRTMTEAPANNFAFEAMRLMPAPTDALRAVEPGALPWGDMPERVAAIAAQGLPTEQVAALQAMRVAEDGDSAFARGGALSPAVRLYAAGAVDFHGRRLESAVARFEAVLALPEPERRMRSVWAAYMLGRSHARAGAEAPAFAAFARSRALALAGAEDPLGLAVDSYGEEAAIHLRRAMARLGDDTLPVAAVEDFARDIAAAVVLYAEQAARGSDCGVQSLRIVAERLLKHPDALGAVLAFPLVQRLVVTYAMARIEDESDPPADPAEPGAAWRYRPPGILATLVAALEAGGIEQMADADRLAALAYRTGRYDLAASLARRGVGPLALWVRAKLALQGGDLAMAAAIYDEAMAAAEQEGGTTLEPSSRARLLGESGVLMLARGQFVAALQRVMSVYAYFKRDAERLAQRVLTLDEFKAVVDASVPERPPVEPPRGDDPSPPPYQGADMNLDLRHWLAGRLMRAGRFDEAPPYVAKGEMRDKAEALSAAMRTAETAWSSVGRAQGWFAAAEIVRRDGDRMMGNDGEMSNARSWAVATAFVSPGERERVLASAGPPGWGWYGYGRAADFAVRAADLLPARSQAFAAVMCHATRWMLRGRDEARARELYRRYLREGAFVPWATRFGRDCPAPDFAAAEDFAHQQMWREVRAFLSRNRWPIVAVGFASIGLAAWCRRHRVAAT